MKIVFDTNVLLAGVFTRGLCETLLDACAGSDEHVMVLSEYILNEFARSAKTKFGAPEAKIQQTVAFLRRVSQVVEPAAVPVDSCRDPDDLPILGTLVVAQADCLVTGDHDLLSLQTFHATPILSPRDLLDRLSRD